MVAFKKPVCIIASMVLMRCSGRVIILRCFDNTVVNNLFASRIHNFIAIGVVSEEGLGA